MERVHTEKILEKKEFDVPDSVSKVSICRICGKLAVEGVCSSYGSEKTEYFAKDTNPKEYCSCHQTAAIKKKPSKPKSTE